MSLSGSFITTGSSDLLRSRSVMSCTYLESASFADKPDLVGSRVYRPVGLNYGDDCVAFAVDGLLSENFHGCALVGLQGQ